ncbi:MAG: hypothetical protein ACRD01_06720, partial [Terriglobales bacterium]
AFQSLTRENWTTSKISLFGLQPSFAARQARMANHSSHSATLSATPRYRHRKAARSSMTPPAQFPGFSITYKGKLDNQQNP